MAQQYDRIDIAAASSQPDEKEIPATGPEPANHNADARYPTSQRGGFDWFALSIVILIAAIFSIAGRLYAQPTTSLVPVAVLSASGCGLLITGLRKLHTSKGVGLLEAALAALFVVVFQFIGALSYPGVVPSLGDEQLAGPGFFSTWGLIVFFSVLFSIIGATLGHLAFAPLRPLPAKKVQEQAHHAEEDNDADLENPQDVGAPFMAPTAEADEAAEGAMNGAPTFIPKQEDTFTPEEGDLEDTPAQAAELPTEARENQRERAPQRTITNYAITVLLLGFVPMLAGYVFAAAFDYVLSRNGYAPGPFPTLRLLSSLLPWQIPYPVGPLAASSPSLTLSLLWRIPLFFGNPAPFDAQAIEPYIFNAAGLGLLLLAGFKQENARAKLRLPWSKLIFLEALLGLAIVLPADLWMMQGLQGVFQFHSIILPLGTLRLLDPLTFVLNILMGIAVCIPIGILVATRAKRD